MSKALIAGASGAVGRHLLTVMLESDRYREVVSLVRRPSGVKHPKLTEQCVDFDALLQYQLPPGVEDVYCCLGTTRRVAGSDSAFKKVDRDYVVNLGTSSKQFGVKRFCVISSSGIDSRWGGLYLNTKREMESALTKLGFNHLIIARPGILHGARESVRPGEQLGVWCLKPLAWIPLSFIQDIKPVSTQLVAQAMFYYAGHTDNMVEIISNSTIHSLSR